MGPAPGQDGGAPVSSELSFTSCDVCGSPRGWRGLGVCNSCLDDWMKSPEQREGIKRGARPESERWREWSLRARKEKANVE